MNYVEDNIILIKYLLIALSVHCTFSTAVTHLHISECITYYYFSVLNIIKLEATQEHYITNKSEFHMYSMVL